jgi:predicted nucleotidyltransferase
VTGQSAKMRPVDDNDSSFQLRTVAYRVVERLSAHRDIDAVLLFGSVARGDAATDSDVDLLVLGRDADQTILGLRRWVGRADSLRQASYVFHTRESFAELVADGSRFLVHLRTEGEVLLDRTGQLSAFMSSPWEAVPVEEEIALELERLRNYDRPEIFGGRFLFALAHTFTIGKAIVMARLADEGHLEFNREKAFEAFAKYYPQLATDIWLIADLEPFVARTRRKTVSLPFSPSGAYAERRLEDGVAAVRRVAQSQL